MTETVPQEMTDLVEPQQAATDRLMDLPNVTGVGLGHKFTDGADTGRRAITVLVERKLPPELLAPGEAVPESVDGVPTDVREVGRLEAGGGQLLEDLDVPSVDELEQMVGAQRSTAQSLRGRVRPVRGGHSVGHPRVTAGTMATACYDLADFPGRPSRYYLLSNNHVIAATNTASTGDPVLQPGRADGGDVSRDVVARLTRFVPIRWHSGTDRPLNYVDAAIAEGDLADLDRSVYWVGTVKKLYTAPSVGDVVQKTGRTTGFTTGRVTNINATVDVNYGGGKVARFARQVVTTAMSAGGDSGSLVTDLDEGGVGLLFAGSSQATILNNLLYVQSLLRVRITER